MLIVGIIGVVFAMVGVFIGRMYGEQFSSKLNKYDKLAFVLMWLGSACIGLGMLSVLATLIGELI